MAIKLVVLKSGEDLIADVKEIQSENSNEVIGYYFYNPLLLKLVSVDPKPIVLSEENGYETELGITKEFQSKVRVTFYPWIPLSQTRDIPCSADWVVTIVDPLDHVLKMYKEKIDGRPDTTATGSDTSDDKGSVIAE